MDTIALTIAVMAAGVVFGAGVQKITHFLDPLDFFTAVVVAAVPALWWMQSEGMVALPVDSMWGWPLLAGYLAGYLVSGRVDYTMIRTFSGNKCTMAEPCIFYTKDGTDYLQEQTWTALAKRMFLGIGHEVIVSGGALSADWTDVAKWPHFPKREHGEIMAESVETYVRDSPKRFRPKRYVTVITLAYGSAVSTTELVRDSEALARANKILVETQNENFALKQSLNMKLADSVAYFLSRVYSKAPGASFLETMRTWERKETEDEKDGKNE